MESLKEVLMRVCGISELEADVAIQRCQLMIASGKTPEEVLVGEYGIDIEFLNEILSPQPHVPE